MAYYYNRVYFTKGETEEGESGENQYHKITFDGSIHFSIIIIIISININKVT